MHVLTGTNTKKPLEIEIEGEDTSSVPVSAPTINSPEPDNLLEELAAIPTATEKAALPQTNNSPALKPISDKQKAFITNLRQQCMELGLNALATQTVRPYTTFADAHIKMLMSAISDARKNNLRKPVENPRPPITDYRPVSPKQWKYIKHLRATCYKNKLVDLAKKPINNSMTEANNYIKEMLAALNKGKTGRGGMICCCRVEGCKIGPFINR